MHKTEQSTEATNPVEASAPVAQSSDAADELPLVVKQDIDEVIRKRVYGSLALGLAPIPLLDFVGIGAIQVELVHTLAKRFNVPFRKDLAKTLIISLVGGIVPVGLAGPVASVLKFIPVIGYTTSAVSMSLLGGASTYAVGHIFAKHFAAGGTLIDMNIESVRESFKVKYQEGKEYVAALRSKKERKSEV